MYYNFNEKHVKAFIIILVFVLIGIIILSTVSIASSPLEKETVEHVVSKSYDVSDEERDLLAKLVFAEASICSFECKVYIVSVVFNRLDSGYWRKDMNADGCITVYDVVYYPNAFTPATYGKLIDVTPEEESYEAVDYVINNGVQLPTEVRYFRSDYDFSWTNYSGFVTVDNVYFGYFTDWRNGVW